ncbi:hypothetical protein KIPB_006177, partial [Kipferlia bialata]
LSVGPETFIASDLHLTGDGTNLTFQSPSSDVVIEIEDATNDGQLKHLHLRGMGGVGLNGNVYIEPGTSGTAPGEVVLGTLTSDTRLMNNLYVEGDSLTVAGTDGALGTANSSFTLSMESVTSETGLALSILGQNTDTTTGGDINIVAGSGTAAALGGSVVIDGGASSATVGAVYIGASSRVVELGNTLVETHMMGDATVTATLSVPTIQSVGTDLTITTSPAATIVLGHTASSVSAQVLGAAMHLGDEGVAFTLAGTPNTGGAGQTLTLEGQSGTTTGGDLVVTSGSGGSGAGGDLYLRAATGSIPGHVYVGDSATSSVRIASTGVTTHVDADLSVDSLITGVSSRLSLQSPAQEVYVGTDSADVVLSHASKATRVQSTLLVDLDTTLSTDLYVEGSVLEVGTASAAFSLQARAGGTDPLHVRGSGTAGGDVVINDSVTTSLLRVKSQTVLEDDLSLTPTGTDYAIAMSASGVSAGYNLVVSGGVGTSQGGHVEVVAGAGATLGGSLLLNAGDGGTDGSVVIGGSTTAETVIETDMTVNGSAVSLTGSTLTLGDDASAYTIQRPAAAAAALSTTIVGQDDTVGTGGDLYLKPGCNGATCAMVYIGRQTSTTTFRGDTYTEGANRLFSAPSAAADRTIGFEATTLAGSDLYLSGHESTVLAGGDVYVVAGKGSTSGGDLYLRAGNGATSDVLIGDIDTDTVVITPPTTIAGDLTVTGSMTETVKVYSGVDLTLVAETGSVVSVGVDTEATPVHLRGQAVTLGEDGLGYTITRSDTTTAADLSLVGQTSTSQDTDGGDVMITGGVAGTKNTGNPIGGSVRINGGSGFVLGSVYIGDEANSTVLIGHTGGSTSVTEVHGELSTDTLMDRTGTLSIDGSVGVVIGSASSETYVHSLKVDSSFEMVHDTMALPESLDFTFQPIVTTSSGNTMYITGQQSTVLAGGHVSITGGAAQTTGGNVLIDGGSGVGTDGQVIIGQASLAVTINAPTQIDSVSVSGTSTLDTVLSDNYQDDSGTLILEQTGAYTYLSDPAYTTVIDSDNIWVGTAGFSSTIDIQPRVSSGTTVSTRLIGMETTGAQDGGDVHIHGGISASGAGGMLCLSGGSGGGSDGVIRIGQFDTSEVQIAASGIDTSVLGDLVVEGLVQSTNLQLKGITDVAIVAPLTTVSSTLQVDTNMQITSSAVQSLGAADLVIGFASTASGAGHNLSVSAEASGTGAGGTLTLSGGVGTGSVEGPVVISSDTVTIGTGGTGTVTVNDPLTVTGDITSNASVSAVQIETTEVVSTTNQYSLISMAGTALHLSDEAELAPLTIHSDAITYGSIASAAVVARPDHSSVATDTTIAGQAGTSGGDLLLVAGEGTSTTGGDVKLRAGVGTGTNGIVYVGDTNTSSISLGQSGQCGVVVEDYLDTSDIQHTGNISLTATTTFAISSASTTTDSPLYVHDAAISMGKSAMAYMLTDKDLGFLLQIASTTSGSGQTLVIQGQDTTSTGGNVIITAGDGDSAGTGGNVFISGGNGGSGGTYGYTSIGDSNSAVKLSDTTADTLVVNAGGTLTAPQVMVDALVTYASAPIATADSTYGVAYGDASSAQWVRGTGAWYGEDMADFTFSRVTTTSGAAGHTHIYGQTSTTSTGGHIYIAPGGSSAVAGGSLYLEGGNGVTDGRVVVGAGGHTDALQVTVPTVFDSYVTADTLYSSANSLTISNHGDTTTVASGLVVTEYIQLATQGADFEISPEDEAGTTKPFTISGQAHTGSGTGGTLNLMGGASNSGTPGSVVIETGGAAGGSITIGNGASVSIDLASDTSLIGGSVLTADVIQSGGGAQTVGGDSSLLTLGDASTAVGTAGVLLAPHLTAFGTASDGAWLRPHRGTTVPYNMVVSGMPCTGADGGDLVLRGGDGSTGTHGAVLIGDTTTDSVTVTPNTLMQGTLTVDTLTASGTDMYLSASADIELTAPSVTMVTSDAMYFSKMSGIVSSGGGCSIESDSASNLLIETPELTVSSPSILFDTASVSLDLSAGDVTGVDTLTVASTIQNKSGSTLTVTGSVGNPLLLAEVSSVSGSSALSISGSTVGVTGALTVVDTLIASSDIQTHQDIVAQADLHLYASGTDVISVSDVDTLTGTDQSDMTISAGTGRTLSLSQTVLVDSSASGDLTLDAGANDIVLSSTTLVSTIKDTSSSVSIQMGSSDVTVSDPLHVQDLISARGLVHHAYSGTLPTAISGLYLYGGAQDIQLESTSQVIVKTPSTKIGDGGTATLQMDGTASVTTASALTVSASTLTLTASTLSSNAAMTVTGAVVVDDDLTVTGDMSLSGTLDTDSIYASGTLVIESGTTGVDIVCPGSVSFNTLESFAGTDLVLKGTSGTVEIDATTRVSLVTPEVKGSTSLTITAGTALSLLNTSTITGPTSTDLTISAGSSAYVDITELRTVSFGTGTLTLTSGARDVATFSEDVTVGDRLRVDNLYDASGTVRHVRLAGSALEIDVDMYVDDIYAHNQADIWFRSLTTFKADVAVDTALTLPVSSTYTCSHEGDVYYNSSTDRLAYCATAGMTETDVEPHQTSVSFTPSLQCNGSTVTPSSAVGRIVYQGDNLGSVLLQVTGIPACSSDLTVDFTFLNGWVIPSQQAQVVGSGSTYDASVQMLSGTDLAVWYRSGGAATLTTTTPFTAPQALYAAFQVWKL